MHRCLAGLTTVGLHLVGEEFLEWHHNEPGGHVIILKILPITPVTVGSRLKLGIVQEGST